MFLCSLTFGRTWYRGLGSNVRASTSFHKSCPEISLWTLFSDSAVFSVFLKYDVFIILMGDFFPQFFKNYVFKGHAATTANSKYFQHLPQKVVHINSHALILLAPTANLTLSLWFCIFWVFYRSPAMCFVTGLFLFRIALSTAPGLFLVSLWHINPLYGYAEFCLLLN